MSDSKSQPKIAVVLATRDRAALLADRALPSVVAQTRRPDYLVVVDDSSVGIRVGNRNAVASLNLPGVQVNYLENERTVGASGSWNTAVDLLYRQVDDPVDLFVAILDDDDVWMPDYLARCSALACDQALDMVAADMQRVETPGGTPLPSEAPDFLCAADFLTGNPGIQGSNLFLRLNVLLAAGGFDEGLRSTTDRDLCIRICDLGTVHYGRLAVPLVLHFADPARSRLSRRGSEAKLEGLTAFWRKYSGRMTATQQEAFCHRARRLFDWRPTPDRPDGYLRGNRNALKDADPRRRSGGIRARLRFADDAHPHGELGPGHKLEAGASTPDHSVPPHKPFTLYVGIITSDRTMLEPLLGDLVALRPISSIARLVALVLENGGPGQEARRAVHERWRAGLEVAFISEEQQRRDAAAGAFGGPYRVRPRGQVGIAQARTMLQRYLGTLLRTDTTAFAWILDDDMRVDGRARAYLPWLPAFRQQGVDALIGQYEGSSPNPPINGVRVQLVDLLHNLVWLQALDPALPLPDRSAENQVLREKYPDYYYDLSRKHTGHLELPHWLEPAFEEETAGEAYSRLGTGAIGILSGEPLTRPLVVYMPSDPLAAARDSVNRGGCTFVLDHRPLTQTPNLTMRLGSREARRSDMMWALINRYRRGMTIKRVGFPILHLGRVTKSPDLNMEKVTGELVGAACYAALTDFLHDKPRHNLNFSRKDRDRVCSLVEGQLTRRLFALALSFHRIRGLNTSIRRLSKLGPLEQLTDHLDRWFTPEVFAAIHDGTRIFRPNDLDEFLSSLPDIADEYARATVGIDFIHGQLHG